MSHLRNRSRRKLRAGRTWSRDGSTTDSLSVGGGDPGPSGRVCVRAGQRPAAEGDAGGPRRRRGPTFPGRDPAPARVGSRRRNAASALVGFVLQQSALRTGVLAPAIASCNAATLFGSIVFGTLVYGEAISDGGARLAPALIGLGMALVGITLLAGVEPPVREQSAPG